MIKPILKSLVFSIFTSFAVTAVAQTPTSTRVITPQGETSGKWFLSLVVSGGVPSAPAFALRQSLTSTFLNAQGNYYRMGFDLDDLSRGSPEPTLEQLQSEFKKIKLEIENFKTQNPHSPTMILLSITGHGLTENGRYFYALSNGKIAGATLAQMIVDLGVDETILVIQSCQSGSLANKEFPELLKDMKEAVSADGQKTSRRFAIITPVPEMLNSPLDDWERVITDSLALENSDLDRDGIVTYGEWKNYVLARASREPSFVPSEFAALGLKFTDIRSASGLDPQFWELNMSADTPFFLTPKGVELYQLQKLRVGDFLYREPKFSDEAVRVYREKAVEYMIRVLDSDRDLDRETILAVQGLIQHYQGENLRVCDYLLKRAAKNFDFAGSGI